MAGTIVADTLTHSSVGSVNTQFVVEGSAKAWIATEGEDTPAIRISLNHTTYSLSAAQKSP